MWASEWVKSFWTTHQRIINYSAMTSWITMASLFLIPSLLHSPLFFPSRPLKSRAPESNCTTRHLHTSGKVSAQLYWPVLAVVQLHNITITTLLTCCQTCNDVCSCSALTSYRAARRYDPTAATGKPGRCRTSILTKKNFYVHIISTFLNVKWTKSHVEKKCIHCVSWFSGKLVNLMQPDVRF